MIVKSSSAQLALLVGIVIGAATPVLGQTRVVPQFDIWDAAIGMSVADIPELQLAEIACGTNGGAPSTALAQFEDFAQCQPEPSGLREVYFTYDDEQDYVAKAWDSEYKYLQGGTSVYAHPVIVSVLVDDGGIIRGQRIVTDDRVSDTVRRTQSALASNFKARYTHWDLKCEDIPPQPGENPVGTQFTHQTCTGSDAATGQHVFIEASYLRKAGQQAISRDTQAVNTGYFESKALLELTDPAFAPRTN